MMLTPEIAAMFPTPGEHDEPYSWSLFEVGTQPSGCLIAIGTLEEEGGRNRELKVRVLDVTSLGWHRLVMTSLGRFTGSGVKLTDGFVEVIHPSLRGQGIGTLVFNVVTAWAQRTFPGAAVDPITLVRPGSAAEFDRLTRFYGRAGFTWDRPADDWNRHFCSNPMTVEALKQYPEELLPAVRRVDLTKGITAMLDRMTEADDDRRMVATLRDQLATRRTRWREMGYRLNAFGLMLAAMCGFGAARVLSLL
jgi:GNAT superfamily N-acetyltransferase